MKARREPSLPPEVTQCRALVFHSLDLAARYLANRQKSSQQIWVMSHSPTTISVEVVGHWKRRLGDSPHWGTTERRVEELELRTYERADGILVPCRSAVDAYFNGDASKRSRFQKLRFQELLSGVPSAQITRSRKEVRESLGIAQTTNLVGFVGRYHKDKGFDLFLEAARCALKQSCSNLFFISAGEGPLRSAVSISNYMDLGWQSSHLADLVSACDIIVCPNRVTYFDLAALETMSLGVPILASATGGNTALARLSDGVVLMRTLNGACIAEQLKTLFGEQLLSRYGATNRSAYERHLTEVALAARHEAFANQLLDGQV